MVYDRCRYSCGGIVLDCATASQLVWPHQRREWCAPFIGDAGANVVGVRSRRSSVIRISGGGPQVSTGR
jgi:hypothetical protein